MSGRLYRGVFGATLVLFGLLVCGGAVYAFRAEGSLPHPGWAYVQELNALLRSKQYERALEQMRLAARLDFDNATAVLPAMAEVARKTGDRDAEIFALRSLIARRGADAERRTQLASALLSGGEVGEEALAEAEALCLAVIEEQPESAVALLDLGSVAFERGDQDEARSRWKSAFELAPDERRRFVTVLRERHPTLGRRAAPETR